MTTTQTPPPNLVRFGRRSTVTHTVVMRAATGTVRWIKAEHQDPDKFVD